MSWYTACVIVSCRLKEGAQDIFPVEENFVLFEALSSEDAMAMATQYALNYCEITSDSLTLNDQPAHWHFDGIRELVEIKCFLSQNLIADQIEDGSEIYCAYMKASDEESLKAFVDGKATEVCFLGQDQRPDHP